MRGFVLRMLISALGIWIASEIVPGVEVQSPSTIFAAALLLGIANAVVRPFLVIITLPITVLTLGLFLLVINAGMLGLAASFLPGFGLAGFSSALLGSLVISAVSWVGSWYIGPSGRVQAVRRGGRRR